MFLTRKNLNYWWYKIYDGRKQNVWCKNWVLEEYGFGPRE